MIKKLLIGIINNKIALMDQDTSKKAKRAAISEGCESIFVCEYTKEISEAWINETEINLGMFIKA